MATLEARATLEPERKEEVMKVSDVMTTKVFTATRDMPLRLAATRILEYGISGMPVVDGERVLGVLSETDILFKERTAPDRQGLVDWLVHYGEDPPAAKLAARTVGDAMTTPAVTIGSGKLVAEAAELMLDLRIDRLPVVDAGELVGIVTRADLVRAFTRKDEEIEREIRDEVILKTLWVNPTRVKVHVEDGCVTLEGRVDNEGVAEQIVHFVQRVPGVVSIEPRLTWPRPRAPRAVGKTLA
jgi:CBS domain-containing protein